MKRFFLTALCLSLAALVLVAQATPGCPFCGPSAQTFTQEMEVMDVVVIAKLTKPPPPIDPSAPSDVGADLSKAEFMIGDVLKGATLVDVKKPIETLYFGEGVTGKQFLIMGVRETPESEKLQWSTPLLLSERAIAYLHKLPTLPKEGTERLEFFQQHLEDADESLARDSYDEFANASYDAVKGLKPKMDRQQLIQWIKNEDIPAGRRRLYLTMLGVCGTKDDVPMLEEMLRASDRKAKAGLDAMIGCYLTLTGEEGVPLIEELYLANPKSEYADTYSAIMAMRFHGTDGGVIPKERVIKAMRHMLDRPKLADLVIPDLARWQDWESMDELVKLFKTADETSSWVRVPVVNYLRACPLPEAKEHLKELEKLDPESIRRANNFFPGPAGAIAPTDNKASEAKPPAQDEAVVAAAATPEKESSANFMTLLCVPGVIGLALIYVGCLKCGG